MFDSFLNDILKVIIVVDILAVVAYFTIGARRRKAIPSPARESFVPPMASEQPLDLQRDRITTSQVDIPLYERVTAHLRRTLSRSRRSGKAASAASESLETAFLNLRRVLSSYHQELA